MNLKAHTSEKSIDPKNSGALFLGTQGWAYNTWVGTFYPTGVAREDRLAEYAKHFRAVELDGTYYAIPRRENVLAWRDATPTDFRFAAKFPKAIVRDKALKDAETETQEFLAAMELFGDKLGPLLLQFSYSFHVDQRERLANYLAALPKNFRYAVEVRHPDWFADPFYKLLKQHRVALVLSDYGKVPTSLPVTTDFTYIRLLGSREELAGAEARNQPLDRAGNLGRWSDFIADATAKGLKVWCFANDIYEGHAPTTIRALMRRIAERV